MIHNSGHTLWSSFGSGNLFYENKHYDHGQVPFPFWGEGPFSSLENEEIALD
jgi:hypothetical protein